MSERLTQRDSDGQAWVNCKMCEAAWMKKHGEKMPDCTALYCRNRLKDRLAEYEDTGLTPEQTEELAHDTTGPLHRKIGEWIEAEAAGRLVVLQCKVGDTVWRYSEDFGRVLPYTIDLISFVDNGCGYSANCNHNGELLDGIDFEDGDIGKMVFLTREEAEKALEEV